MNEELWKRLWGTTDKKKGPWREKGPKVPPKRRSKPRQTRTANEDSESTIQREVVLQARRMGIRLFRQQAGKIFAGIHPIQLAPEGAADLTGILPNGIRLEVECKRRFGGVQSQAQKEWQKFIEENNGIYLLVHSGKELKEKIEPMLKELL
jgi:hypothetical protein